MWVVVAFIFLVLDVAVGICGGYLNSAHGSPAYGVARGALINLGVSKGNCAHCHELHGSINGTEQVPVNGSPSPFALFSPGYVSQTQGFCLDCHNGATTVSNDIIKNYSYSYRAGGWTNDTVTNLVDAFDDTVMLSVHDLGDILDYLCNNTSWNFKCETSPCVGCHNPHFVQGDPLASPDPKSATNRGWLLTRPSKHGSTLSSDFLWGDEPSERMSAYVSSLGMIYQAPYRFLSTSTYEPDGSTVTDGSNLADMVSFCMDCHSADFSGYGLTNTPINWGTSGDKHGANAADGDLSVRAPYSSSNMGSYVLACTDCHEPHGSPNLFLIRPEVNGDVLIGTIQNWSSAELGYLCMRCHLDDASVDPVTYGTNPNKWEYVHHHAPDAPYAQWRCGSCHSSYPINCTKCHYHGSTDPNVGKTF